MPFIDSGGVSIHYVDEGAGDPVVLVHGFAASLEANWRAPGVISALITAGRRVIALDCRGHGKSDKPRDFKAYGGTRMADDVLAVMDKLSVDRADLVGYSMGGLIAASLPVRHPERFRSVTLAGVGDALVAGFPAERSASIARALESDDGGKSENPAARAFRVFAERSGNDLSALAAMQRARRGGFDPAKLAAVKLPVMVLVGAADTLIGSADRLAAAIPGATYVKVPGDHLSAVAAPQFRRAIVDFLASAVRA